LSQRIHLLLRHLSLPGFQKKPVVVCSFLSYCKNKNCLHVNDKSPEKFLSVRACLICIVKMFIGYFCLVMTKKKHKQIINLSSINQNIANRFVFSSLYCIEGFLGKNE